MVLISMTPTSFQFTSNLHAWPCVPCPSTQRELTQDGVTND